MQRIFATFAAMFVLFMLAAPLCAASAQPDGYWQYHEAYTNAVKSGNIEQIIEKGNALLDFYSNYEMNYDIAANSTNVYRYLYDNSVYEKRGDYAAAKENLERFVEVLNVVGDTESINNARMKMRKIDPLTGVYALTSFSVNKKYYGAKNEISGTYYGRVLTATENKLNDLDRISDESIASFYTEFGQEDIYEYSWIIDKINDGNKAVHIGWNFPKEGTTVWEINDGWHESYIKRNLEYLGKLDLPVFLRIGAEVNVWTTETTPEAYKSAYTHIAEQTRKYAPNVALVFSVNSASPYNKNEMSTYYPGDKYVDWVGVSLYYNYYHNANTNAAANDFGNMYFGTADWAIPVKSVAEVVQKFGDKKPIMITEGGSGHYNKILGTDVSGFAAERIEMAYRQLTMVYPEIKGIIYFDNDYSGGEYNYDIEASGKTSSAYYSAVEANKTLLHSANGEAMCYAPLEMYVDNSNQRILISAYCEPHYSGDVYVDYYIDGNLAARGSGINHEYMLDVASLSVGNHTFAAVFGDNENFTDIRKYHLVKESGGYVVFGSFDEAPPTSEGVISQLEKQGGADKIGGSMFKFLASNPVIAVLVAVGLLAVVKFIITKIKETF